jgi:hypothetical protein
MTEEHHDTSEFRGARFTSADFAGATFRDCNLSGLKVVDCWVVDAHIGGFIRNLFVNDVDVTELVEAELERRHPERVQLRQMKTADDYRAMWDTIDGLWSTAVDRARALPEPVRQERVDDEWSFAETLRHLIFATDAWASSAVLDEPRPFAAIGRTHTGYPAADAAAIGIDADAQPTFDEVLAVRANRMAVVRGIVDALTDAELERVCDRPPAPGYPEEPHTVGQCLRVVMNEECEHHRYATRDLAVLEARS